METPYQRQQTRRHAKRNHIRQRIEFPAKIAGRIRHARNAAIERIKWNRNQNRDRRPSRCVREPFAFRLLVIASSVCVIAK